jgi:hypothetical protein
MHLLCCFLYDGFSLPFCFYFWFLYITILIIVTVIAESLCRQMEMSDIPLGFLSVIDNDKDSDSKSSKKNNPKNDPKNPSTDLNSLQNDSYSTDSNFKKDTPKYNQLNNPDNTVDSNKNDDYNNPNQRQSFDTKPKTPHKSYRSNTPTVSESDDDGDDNGELTDGEYESLPLNPKNYR